MRDFFRHHFTPHHTNNHRAKILHHTHIFFLVIALFVSSLFVSIVKVNFPAVLGASVNISTLDLLNQTNEERIEKGKNTLSLNDKLSQAAVQKAKDMFEKDYWAHNSPSGTTPWKFIKESGYVYVYAGENLARGFETSEDVVNAWMESPTHRENMLSGNYQDVGFAVMTGRLNGEDTVLVVEMFGGQKSSLARTESAPSIPSGSGSGLFNSVLSNSVINSNFWSKNISVAILGIFIVTLFLDMVIVQRKKIARVVGHNLDHVFFFSVLITAIIIISRGVVA